MIEWNFIISLNYSQDYFVAATCTSIIMVCDSFHPSVTTSPAAANGHMPKCGTRRSFSFYSVGSGRPPWAAGECSNVSKMSKFPSFSHIIMISMYLGIPDSYHVKTLTKKKLPWQVCLD